MNSKLKNPLAIMVGVVCTLTAMFAFAGEWTGRTLIGKITVRVDQTVMIVSENGNRIVVDYLIISLFSIVGLDPKTGEPDQMPSWIINRKVRLVIRERIETNRIDSPESH